MPTGSGSRLQGSLSFPIWPWLSPVASVATPAVPAGCSPVLPDRVKCPGLRCCSLLAVAAVEVWVRLEDTGSLGWGSSMT